MTALTSGISWAAAVGGDLAAVVQAALEPAHLSAWISQARDSSA